MKRDMAQEGDDSVSRIPMSMVGAMWSFRRVGRSKLIP